MIKIRQSSVDAAARLDGRLCTVTLTTDIVYAQNQEEKAWLALGKPYHPSIQRNWVQTIFFRKQEDEVASIVETFANSVVPLTVVQGKKDPDIKTVNQEITRLHDSSYISKVVLEVLQNSKCMTEEQKGTLNGFVESPSSDILGMREVIKTLKA